MSAPLATELDCVAVIDRTFGQVLARIDGWRSAIEVRVADAVGGDDADRADGTVVDVAMIDDLVESLVAPALGAADALVIGAGFVASPGFLRDAPWHLAWWLGHANTFGVADRMPAGIRRLVAVEDEHAENFRDYTTLEWWRVPAATGAPHITGPYVDYLCTDDYTLTLTVPVRAAGRMIGVAGADLYVTDVERALLPAVRGIGRPAALVNAAGRVVVASESAHATGSLLRIPDLTARAASADPSPGADGRRVVTCGSTSLVLVLEG